MDTLIVYEVRTEHTCMYNIGIKISELLYNIHHTHRERGENTIVLLFTNTATQLLHVVVFAGTNFLVTSPSHIMDVPIQ